MQTIWTVDMAFRMTEEQSYSTSRATFPWASTATKKLVLHLPQPDLVQATVEPPSTCLSSPQPSLLAQLFLIRLSLCHISLSSFVFVYASLQTNVMSFPQDFFELVFFNPLCTREMLLFILTLFSAPNESSFILAVSIWGLNGQEAWITAKILYIGSNYIYIFISIEI